MLGKIFTVCMLVVVSACLVRPETSKPNLAGVAGKVAEDVSLLLRKLGVESTDEAMTKLWAEVDELSTKDKNLLVKLLKSSDGAAALAALQRPVRRKLEKADMMLTEYDKSLSASNRIHKRALKKLYEAVEDVARYSTKYEEISKQFSPYLLARIEYPADQVTKVMAKLSKANENIASINHLKDFYPVGKLEDVIEANFVIANLNKGYHAGHDRIYEIAESIMRSNPDQLIIFKKFLENKKYDADIQHIYRLFVSDKGGTQYTENIHRAIERLNPSPYTNVQSAFPAKDHYNMERFIVGSLNDAVIGLDYLQRGLKARPMFLEKSGIGAARRAEIEAGSLRTAGAYGEEFATMKEWNTAGISRLSIIIDSLGKMGVDISNEVRRKKSFVEKAFREIEQM